LNYLNLERKMSEIMDNSQRLATACFEKIAKNITGQNGTINALAKTVLKNVKIKKKKIIFFF